MFVHVCLAARRQSVQEVSHKFSALNYDPTQCDIYDLPVTYTFVQTDPHASVPRKPCDSEELY